MQPFTGVRNVDQQSTAISGLAGVEADLVYLAPTHAICDARPVAADLIYHDRTGEIYLMQCNPRQRWHYVPAMRADEALLSKCHDSARDGRAVWSPHAAFDDPTAPADVLPRESIEPRTIAFHPA
jgi:hypothetical protein